jgi:hypothetical protein
MREASYNSTLATEIEEEIGGRVIKLSDRATLGLPDSLHILDSIVTFIEIKIGEKVFEVDGQIEVEPWKAINDLRQYEVCRAISKYATMIYMIYYPTVKMTAVLPIQVLGLYNPLQCSPAAIRLREEPYLVNGHGVETLQLYLRQRRNEIRAKLNV